MIAVRFPAVSIVTSESLPFPQKRSLMSCAPASGSDLGFFPAIVFSPSGQETNESDDSAAHLRPAALCAAIGSIEWTCRLSLQREIAASKCNCRSPRSWPAHIVCLYVVCVAQRRPERGPPEISRSYESFFDSVFRFSSLFTESP